jgi:hypothetical protein
MLPVRQSNEKLTQKRQLNRSVNLGVAACSELAPMNVDKYRKETDGAPKKKNCGPEVAEVNVQACNAKVQNRKCQLHFTFSSLVGSDNKALRSLPTIENSRVIYCAD